MDASESSDMSSSEQYLGPGISSKSGISASARKKLTASLGASLASSGQTQSTTNSGNAGSSGMTLGPTTFGDLEYSVKRLTRDSRLITLRSHSGLQYFKERLPRARHLLYFRLLPTLCAFFALYVSYYGNQAGRESRVQNWVYRLAGTISLILVFACLGLYGYVTAIGMRPLEQSILAVRGLGLQITHESVSGSISTNFVEFRRVKDIVILENVYWFTVVCYVALLVNPANPRGEQTPPGGLSSTAPSSSGETPARKKRTPPQASSHPGAPGCKLVVPFTQSMMPPLTLCIRIRRQLRYIFYNTSISSGVGEPYQVQSPVSGHTVGVGLGIGGPGSHDVNRRRPLGAMGRTDLSQSSSAASAFHNFSYQAMRGVSQDSGAAMSFQKGGIKAHPTSVSAGAKDGVRGEGSQIQMLNTHAFTNSMTGLGGGMTGLGGGMTGLGGGIFAASKLISRTSQVGASASASAARTQAQVVPTEPHQAASAILLRGLAGDVDGLTQHTTEGVESGTST